MKHKLIMENWRLYKEACEQSPGCNCVDSSESPLSVGQIQKILNIAPTGICDQETVDAIMTFQEINNIKCDGCVGDETHNKMLELGITDMPLISGPHGSSLAVVGMNKAADSTPAVLTVRVESSPSSNTSSVSNLGQDPLRGAGRRTSKFHATSNRSYKHNGQDFSAKLGTPIYPIAPGVVISVRTPEKFIRDSQRALKKSPESIPFIGNDMRLVDYNDERIQGRDPSCDLNSFKWVQNAFATAGFKSWKEGGIWVMIKHDSLKVGEDSVTAWYAHLHDLNVSVGDTVDMDTVIGTVGRSGVVCNQPHLHLETFTGQNTAAVSGRATHKGKRSTFDPLNIIA